MAHENKRARDERRFGKANLLGDAIVSTPKEAVANFRGQASDKSKAMALELAETIRNRTRDATLIAADNVARYYFEHPQRSWGIEDFPSVAPVFPAMFIEYGRVPLVVDGDSRIVNPEWMADRFGCLFEYFDMTEAISSEFQWAEPSARWAAVAFPSAQKNGRVFAMGCCIYFSVMGDGRMPSRPEITVAPAPESHMEETGSLVWSHILPLFLAISFMNCKNVTTEAREPCPAINRERRKAGLKPFLRHHTINIEPMKAVLKHEGGIETNGLKKALHIARGHFKTYSPDRPLFGHFAGTVWCPSHVRGTAKAGVVVSDYNVNPPRGDRHA